MPEDKKSWKGAVIAANTRVSEGKEITDLVVNRDGDNNHPKHFTLPGRHRIDAYEGINLEYFDDEKGVPVVRKYWILGICGIPKYSCEI